MHDRSLVIKSWFQRGLNTNEIAKKMKIEESECERMLHHALYDHLGFDDWGKELKP